MTGGTLFDPSLSSTRWVGKHGNSLIHKESCPIYINEQGFIACHLLRQGDEPIPDEQTNLYQIAERVWQMNAIEELNFLKWDQKSCQTLAANLTILNSKIQKHNHNLEKVIEETWYLKLICLISAIREYIFSHYSIEEFAQPIQLLQHFDSNQRTLNHKHPKLADGGHDLRNCQFTPEEMESYRQAFPNVTSFILGEKVKNKMIRSLVRTFPNIKSVCCHPDELDSIEYLNLENSSFFALGKADQLKEVQLPGADVTNRGLRKLADCKQLEQVNLAGCERITSLGVEALIYGCLQLQNLMVPAEIFLDAPVGVFQRWWMVRNRNNSNLQLFISGEIRKGDKSKKKVYGIELLDLSKKNERKKFAKNLEKLLEVPDDQKKDFFDRLFLWNKKEGKKKS